MRKGKNMDLIFDIVGTIILVSFVVAVVLLPFIGVWRGIMIPKRWEQVEVMVTRHEFYLGGVIGVVRGGKQEGRRFGRFGGVLPWGDFSGGIGRARIHIKYTIEGLTYESFFYKGRARHHILPPVGTRETRYYNPKNPNMTFSKEECDSKIRHGIILGCCIAFFIFLIVS